jgi:predicted phage tail protein
MGEVPHLEITGAKGGESKPKSPVEAPDSLQSTNIAKLLLAVGEGEFEGKPTDRDIYLDNTPIMDASGNVNFPGVKWEWRSGSVEQGYIQGIPAVENENSVGVELRSDSPFTRALSDTKLSAVRVRLSWPRLLSQDSNGNTNGYRIEYAIDIATDGGAYVEAHRGAVDGKSANGYQRSVRVNLPASTSGWMMRVRRITPNANKGAIADTMTVAGYTEIIDEKLCYPNTALLYIEFDAQQFQNIPAVTVKCKAKRWPVPSNYDPIARTYTGIWDGTFKQAWTNNPAFVTYGLCVEDRFGLGKRIKPWMVDKWEMYRIAQYCDQRVPDGVGGTEPRFLCDMNLQGRSEAWVLLRDLSAIYRGMVYWAHGALFMQADMPRSQDIDYVFTRSNVVGGDFVYGGAERSSHYSRALVSYDNPANNYETDVIPSTDVSLQRRFRDRPIEISAIGCTRASEAQRRGKWALLSNSQDRTVTFRTGMEGRIPLPGYVIPVADELVAGRPNGGRISAVAGLVITLDRDTPIKAGDRLIVNLPNGTAQARTVKSVSGRAVTVTTAYSTQPEPQLQWAIDYQDLAVQLFRVLRTMRTDKGQYEITALEFNPSKFAAIDTGAKLDERPISVIPVTTVQPPASVTLASSYMIDQGIAVNTMTISWAAVAGAVAYEVEWRKDNGNWVRLQRTGATSIDVTGIYAGAYLAQVRAVSAYDISSTWKSSVLTQLNGKQGLPPSITSLTAESLLFGIGLKWTFPPGAEDTQRTELWYSAGTDLAKATKLADLAYPQDKHTLQGLRAGQRFYFWARLVDKSGNVGPWFPSGTTLVAGMSSADAGPILEQIKDQITESELGKALTSKIEKIELIDGNGPGSVNERVTTASNAIKADVNKQLIQVNSTIDGVRSNLQGQVTAVEGRMTTARDDLQRQIDGVSSIAGALPYNKAKTYALDQAVLGANGKLYQAKKAVPVNVAPPNTDYWEDVGQSVRTANGTASAVSKLQTDVTTLGDTVTATSGKVDGFQASINTANSNASAAQGAAQAANDLAGGKGKVIVQNAAPAAADRLPQNLWIDTTSGANTPKRWNGSAWVAVTDKVATDAAAAAQSALNQVGSKADASAVNSLKLTVDQQGRDLTSQSTTLSGMQTAIDGKASSQALTQLTSRVKLTEDKDGQQDETLRSQSESLTTLKDTVAKKADVSTVNQLANDVKTQGDTVSAQGSSLTKIEAGLPLLGGENLLYNPSLDKGSAALPTNPDGWAVATGGAVGLNSTLVDSTLDPAGKALRCTMTLADTGAFVDLTAAAERRPAAAPGQVFTLSGSFRSTPGIIARLYFQWINASGAVISTDPASPEFNGAETWQRFSWSSGVAPPGTVAIRVIYRFHGGRSGSITGYAEWDRLQIESGLTMTGWRDNGQTNAANSLANAQATTALIGRVEKTEQGLSSASQQTTQLSNSLTTTNGNVDKAQKAAQDAATLAGGKGKVIVQTAAPAVADQLPQNLWIDTSNGANTPKRWSGSAWTAVTDKVATDAAAAAQNALNQLGSKADASALSALGSTVDQQGRDLTAAGRSVTELTASIGNVGSENLLFNPSLDVLHPSRAGLAAGWDLGNASANLAYSLVASTLDPAGKAIRLDLTINGGSSYVDLAPERAYWPAVPSGQAMAMSGYFRATTGMIAQLYVQWFDAAGANIRTDGAASAAANGSWQRITLTPAPAPASAVKARTIYRIRGPFSGDTVSGFCEWDRMQFEVGDRVSGWRDNGQMNAAQAAANASATTALTSRVSKTEESLTSQSVDITQLKNTLGSGNFVAGRAWEMLNDNLGWYATAADATLTPGPLFSTMRGGNSNLQVSISPAKFSGAENPIVRFRMRRRNTTRVGCRLYWANEDGGMAETRAMPFDVDVSKSDWQEIEIDLSGNSAWVGKTGIYALRLDVTTTSDTKAEVDIAYVAAGRKSVAASSQVVALLGSVVSQQGGDIESTGRQTVELQNSLTTTDGNVTKAQTAADAASKLAGGKGKVIVQSGAPGTDDRLPQNLWIDITGGANTPKRWNGSAWTAVTDKVATDAAAAAQNALNQLGSKADAKALTDLTTRVKDTEDGLSTQASQLTVLGSSIGSAQPFVAGVSWELINSVRGWVATAADGTITAGPAFATVKKPTNLQASNTFGKIVGAQSPYLRIRLRRRNTTRDRAAMYWANEDGGLAENRRIDFSISLSSTDWQDIEVDLSSNTQWVGKTGIYAIRLDMTGSANTACEIDIAYIAVGRRSAAASAQAVSLLETAVTQQGGDLKLTADGVTKLTGDLGKTSGALQDEQKLRIEADSALSDRIITAQAKANDAAAAVQSEMQARVNAVSAVAKRVDDTQTSLGNTNAMVNRTSEAVTDLNNVASASEVVRVQITANGIRHAAGFAVGIENKGGVVQSTFAILADRFAILSPSGDSLSSPFAVQGNQTFIADAYIRDASITNAKIADASINSAKIADASISAAKIGMAEVDTLRIRGNAVTVPISYSVQGQVRGAGRFQWMDIMNISVPMDEAGYVFIMFNCGQYYTSGERASGFTLTINGFQLMGNGGQPATPAPVVSGSIAVGPGVHNIKVTWYGDDASIFLDSRNIFVIGTKR